MTKKLGWILGGILAAVGVLGFVPGITSGGYLLGIFMVDALHNIIHLVSGLLILAALWKYNAYEMLVYKALGVVYAIVAVVGFIQGSTVLGIIGVNMADNLLHVVLAGVFVYMGFFARRNSGMAGGMQQPQQPMGGSDAGQQGM